MSHTRDIICHPYAIFTGGGDSFKNLVHNSVLNGHMRIELTSIRGTMLRRTSRWEANNPRRQPIAPPRERVQQVPDPCANRFGRRVWQTDSPFIGIRAESSEWESGHRAPIEHLTLRKFPCSRIPASTLRSWHPASPFTLGTPHGHNQSIARAQRHARGFRAAFCSRL
jgi:hypothetical protein